MDELSLNYIKLYVFAGTLVFVAICVLFRAFSDTGITQYIVKKIKGEPTQFINSEKDSGNDSKEITSEFDIWYLDDESLPAVLYIYLGAIDHDCLNDVQRTTLSMLKLEMEVNKGGFSQFFLNTDNEWNGVLVASANKIGAYDIAKICERAISILNIYLESNDQVEMLNKECDDAFYKSKDCITKLCVDYARRHKDSFDF